MPKRLILASASPRRVELLKQLGVEFDVMPSQVAEVDHAFLTPREICLLNAWQKCRSVARRRPDAVVLGADTEVCLGARIFGKPASRGEAEAFLMELQGRVHEVVTGVCLMHWGRRRQWLGAEVTRVHFKPLSATEIADYLGLIQPLDKAGAYAIQEHGERIIERIEGSYSNVVGLPLEMLREALNEFADLLKER
ncbi:MAG: Maf family protein [Verrucomicrobiae bacterium]|nr:Maf family protein [Verrucomicrobiae bacterium]